MKEKNRTGILTALLAVLSIQGVEFKKKIGIITAVLAVLVLTSIPAMAIQDPADCVGTSLKIQAIYKDKTLVQNGDVVHYAIWMGTGGAAGACNNVGITTLWARPGVNGLPDLVSPTTLGSNLPFSWTGVNDVCYYESAAGKNSCDVFVPGVQQVQHSNIDWTVNVNPGVTQATGRGIIDCPSNQCNTNAPINDDVAASADISVIVRTPQCGEPGQPPCPGGEEWWEVEWFDILPRQFTELVLPEDGQKYLVTTRLQAPEGEYTLWNNNQDTPIDEWTDDRLKFWHDPANNPEDLYVNTWPISNEATVTTLRVHGIFGEGPGDLEIKDPETQLTPEDAPYTDPISPFFPQGEQAPRKDFVTFNPVYMDHNDHDWDNNGVTDDVYSRIFINDANSQTPAEKIFKRMWYEKNWYKDENKNGVWEVKPNTESNNPEKENNGGDVYGPTISQEFTYMFLNDDKLPILVPSGSRFYIPMASYGQNNGLDSFDANRDGQPDTVQVESEATLGMDIDNHNGIRSMDEDGDEVSADESLVLMLADSRDGIDITLDVQRYYVQFFDHRVEFAGTTRIGGEDAAKLNIFSQEDASPIGVQKSSVNLKSGEIAYFNRGLTGTAVQGPFFVEVRGVARDGPQTVTIRVGRLFGNLAANIGDNDYWNQKAFIVDRVFYNVAAIKAVDDTFKYITFRQELPKVDIKIYGIELKKWDKCVIGTQCEPLAEMPQFNLPHDIMEDVKETHTYGVMDNPLNRVPRPKLDIYWLDESIEDRFSGELKEIYWETNLVEHWAVEWFNILPKQYTELVLPEGEKYLVTTAFRAPEAEFQLYNGADELVREWTDDRFKFWFDAEFSDGLFVNNGNLKVYGYFGEGPGDLEIKDPETQLTPEDAPYTDPISPFFPQGEQAPRKDFVTFDPVYMDHNDPSALNDDRNDFAYSRIFINDPNSQTPAEKIFKRMWYEKNWFKDENKDGVWDKVCCDELGQFPREWNNPEKDNNGGDIYGPTISQEFTYMFLDDNKQPTLVPSGSRFYIPMASRQPDNGLDSFDANGDGEWDTVQVESEATLGLDIDNHNGIRSMDEDGEEVSADESLVLMLADSRDGIDITLSGQNDGVQFFDHGVLFAGTTRIDGVDAAKLNIFSMEGMTPVQMSSVTMKSGEIKYFNRGLTGASVQGPFFVKVIAVARDGTPTVTIQVGRLFGNLAANIGDNDYWNQKAFIVDRVFYNVAAIKAVDDTFKYITFRQELPKVDIKIYGIELKRWDRLGTDDQREPLAEMPQFNMDHTVLQDVLNDPNTHEKMGLPLEVGPLDIFWVNEDKEPRLYGELKEIYNQTGVIPDDGGDTVTCAGDLYPVNLPDGVINVGDFSIFGAAFGTSSGDAGYRAAADLFPNTPDGVIGVGDFSIFGSQFGTSCSSP